MEMEGAHGRQGARFDLRTARLNAGLSMRQLAENVGVGHATIRRLELHHADNPHPEVVKRVADYFGVSVVDLLEEDRTAA